MTIVETSTSQGYDMSAGCAATRIVVARDRTSDEQTWDRFASACGASFRSAYRAAKAWQLDHHSAHRMRRYGIWLEEGQARTKIGQTAIGFGPRLRVFADGLYLLPEYAALWGRAMGAVLSTTGAGLYHYGSAWSLDAAREKECASIPGVTIMQVKPITMYAVDFARWSCWNTYLRDVSENARRNAKKAEKLRDRLTIDVRYGSTMLPDAIHLLSLRRGLYARKQIPFSMAHSAMRLLLRAWAMRDRAFIAVARLDGTPISAFGGVVFGDNTYFIDSGSVAEDHGIYWFLMLRMLRDAYERSPRGRFVTGAYHEGTPVSPGLDFFRHQCRAHGTPTSQFVFRYQQ